MFKKYWIMLVFLCIGLEQVHSQQRFNLQSYAPPTPNAAELGKYGSIPVGTLTGIPDISFPLYEITSGSLKLPVTLSYHASGIQVSQKSTDVGLGWVVNAGGQISRTVYGGADNNPNNGYFNYTPTSYNTLLNTYSYYTMQMYSNPGYDVEPDLYSFNIGGKSGKFIYTRERDFMTIPFEPIKIEVQNPNSRTGTTFKLTDDNGVIYNFTNTSSVIGDWRPSEFYITTWYLTSMISPDYVDTISFEYTSQSVTDYVTTQSYAVGQRIDCSFGDVNVNGDNAGLITSNTSNMNYTELLLSKIRFKGGYLQFNRNTLRSDNVLNSYSLDEIKVYDIKNQLVKNVSFNHGYFDAADASYPSFANKRLKLTGIIESGASLSPAKETKFEYNSITPPSIGSYSMDYWGYYNGQGNLSLIPNTTIPVYDLVSVSFLNSSGSFTNNFAPGYASSNISFGNANREASETFMKAGTLTKIIYPTGGYTEFDYEANKFLSDDYIPQSRYSQNTTQGINFYTLNESSTAFRYPSNGDLDTYNSSGSMSTLTINFSGSNMNNNEYGQTQTAYLIDETANTTQTWQHEGDITQPYSVQTNIRLIVGHSYRLKASVYGSSAVTVSSNISWNENTSVHPVKSGGGLRIKSIKSYSAPNILAKEENYVYGENGNGLGVKLFDERKFFKNYEDVAEYYIKNTIMSNGNSLCVAQGTRWHRNFLGISKYSSLNYGGASILYPLVVKYEGNESTNIGKTIYKYNVYKDETVVPDAFVNSGNYGSINNAWNQADLTDEEIYKVQDGQYQPVEKVHYEYGSFNERTTYGIKIKQIEQVVYICGECMDMQDHTYSPAGGNNLKPGQGFFSFFEYPIKTGLRKKTKETKTVYDPANSARAVTTVTDYEYANSLNRYLTTSKFLASDGITTRINRYTYPNDLGDAVSSAMVAKNILSPVLEEKNYKSISGTESLLSTVQTNYRQSGNLFLRDNIKGSIGNNSLETRVLFNAYDGNGNLLEQQKIGDTKETYIWGYNQMYPVAKITGRSYNEVMSLVSLNTILINDINTDDAAMRQELSKLRGLTNCFVTIYTYKPLVGMTSQTDPNGKTIYYAYDAFGRLQLIRDQDGKVIKKICYNYAGQVTDCSINTTANWTATGTVQCVTSGGVNTGYQQREEKDNNPYSSTYNQTRWVDNGYNTTACPIPSSCTYNNCEINGPQYKCVNGNCEWGYLIYTGSYYDWDSGMNVCVYHYEWSDGSWSGDYYQFSWGECYIN